MPDHAQLPQEQLLSHLISSRCGLDVNRWRRSGFFTGLGDHPWIHQLHHQQHVGRQRWTHQDPCFRGRDADEVVRDTCRACSSVRACQHTPLERSEGLLQPDEGWYCDYQHFVSRRYNIAADLPQPCPPPLHPKTLRPITGGFLVCHHSHHHLVRRVPQTVATACACGCEWLTPQACARPPVTVRLRLPPPNLHS